MKIDPIMMNLMMLETSNVQFIDLLETNKHKKINGIYKYAFIISKYTTALKPINEGTAESIANKIEKSMLSKDFSVFVVGLPKSGWKITDGDVADVLKSVLPRCSKEIINFYREMGAPV